MRELFWNAVEHRLPACLSFPLLHRRSYRYDPAFFDALAAHQPRGRLAVDVGAHRGGTAWFLARRASRVEAFEPNPVNFRALRRLAGPRIGVHEIALSDKAGRATLSVRRDAGGTLSESGSLLEPTGDVLAYEVELRTLDSYAFEDVGFVKIDVEGAEEAVLRGAAGTIRRWRPVLAVEINGDEVGEPALRRTVAGLTAQGYRCRYFSAAGTFDFSGFDLERDQRAARGRDMRYYANNFLFLPA